MLSKLNFYDNKLIPLDPFDYYIGLYEDISEYSSIYIFVDTSGNDILTLQYSNLQIQTSDNSNVVEQVVYNINNTTQNIFELPKLKYFRIKISTDDPTPVYVKRIYYVFFQKEIPSNITISGNLNVNDLITHNILTDVSNGIGTLINTGFTANDVSSHVILTDISNGIGNISSTINNNRLSVIDVSSYGALNNISSTINNNRLSVIDVSSYGALNNISITDVSSYGTLNNISTTLTNGISIIGSTNQPIQTDASGNQIIKFYPTNTDAFGRLRTSNPYTLFEGSNIYRSSPKFTNASSGTGNTTYDLNNSLVNLTVSGGVGHVIREGKYCAYYQPGKSLFSMFTFCMDISNVNLRQMVGYYDCSNGFFFDVCGTTSYFTKRTFISGSVVETKIAQSSWNTNQLPSLNTATSQILWIDMEWLGVGSVRMGFVINGQFILCHQFNHANLINSVYITTPNLPARYEIISTGNLNKTLKAVCCTILSEGGFEFRGISNIIDNVSSTISQDVETPLIAITLNQSSLNAITIPSLLSIITYGSGSSSSGGILYLLRINPTITATNWTSVTNSNILYSINLSNLSGGTIVGSGYTNSSNIIDIGNNRFDLQLGRILTGINTYTSDVLVLSARGIANSQNTYVTFGWNEM
jgi:hypothetical protein